jgi:hypothetical protein
MQNQPQCVLRDELQWPGGVEQLLHGMQRLQGLESSLPLVHVKLLVLELLWCQQMKVQGSQRLLRLRVMKRLALMMFS